MNLENPYRAAGAFSGKAYIRRDADAQLIEQIDDNQYYPYFAAPRQSGKSSLLVRTITALDATRYRCALVDLSPFVVTSYDDFWRQFLHEVARSANFDPTPIGQEDPRDVLLMWLRSCKQRLIVFMDEIDVLLNVDFREQIFSKFRTFFNLRARLDTADLQRLQFVLAGAAHSSRFIKDPRWSPFNVAIEIELEDLTAAQVSQLAAYLGTAGSFAGPDLTARVFELSGGSVFLCQLIFEQLWNQAARGKTRLGPADVDAVVQSIVAESPRNIHFYNIFRLVTADARLTMLFRRLTEGQELGHEEHKELRLTGICRGANPFRNEIYARVFGPAGPLDLKVGDKQIQLTKALDAAIGRRDRLQGDPQADPKVIAATEAEIRRLRKEFREGSQLQAGDVLGRGRFRLEERIGQGGFATVWRAQDTRDQSLVAIKILHGQFAEDKSRRERFFRGAWKMSELQHPAIVRVIEPYGDENGQFYFVMEYLAGGTLYDAVQDLQVGPELALKMLAQIGEALQFAHDRGLVHRDVKPSNVMIEGERGKLTDFDLVRETDITGGTRTGAMGTFLYAAPEVMSRPQDADVRADIYGLGMTAVFALYGADLAMDVIRDADRFIDRLPCNPVIHDVLKKAVAWDRNDRFSSAAEFVAALGRASEVEETPVRSRSAGAVAVSEAAPVIAAMPAMQSPAAMPAVMPVMPSPAPMPAPMPMSAPGGSPPVVGPQMAAASPADGPGRRATLVNFAKAQPTGAMLVRASEVKVGTDEPSLAGRATAMYGVPEDSPGDDDDAFLYAEEVAPWDREILVPERTDTRMLREAVERVESAAPLAASAITSSGEHAPAPRRPDTGRVSTRLDAAPRGERTVSTHAVPPAQARGGWRLGLALALVAVAVPLAYYLPRLLGPDEASPGRIAAEERGPRAVQPGPVVIPDAEPVPTPPRMDPEQLLTAGSGAPIDPPIDPSRAGADEAGAEHGTTEADSPAATGASAAHSDSDERPGTQISKATEPQPQPKPRISDQIASGCAQVSGGDAEKGMVTLLRAFDRMPGDMRLLLCIADGYAKLGNYESAANFYERLLDRWPRHVRGLLGAAQANEYLSRRAAAMLFYNRLLEVDPDNRSAQAFFKEEGQRRPGG